VSDQTANALIAVALGTVVAIVLLIPTAAVQYRRDGRLGFGDLSILLSGAVYGLALWTYTLLPVPPAGAYSCKGEQLDPFGTIRLIWSGGADGPLGLLRDEHFLQVVFNVLLFVPLGYFLRVIVRRGVAVAGLAGLATSLLIEVTQLTGDWGIYGCAYRQFDVDDLMINTLGAIGGSLLSAIFVDRAPKAVRLPTRISFGRRLVGMVCDALFIVLLGAAIAVGYRAWQEHGPGGDADPDVQTWLQLGGPFVAEALCVLVLGKTVGEWVVDLRTKRRRTSVQLARLVKLAFGVGPVFALALLDGWWMAVGLAAYAVLTVVVAATTAGHRGLSNVVAGLDLEIDFEPDHQERVRSSA
jgi:glycopeptide antibiotics resistance protein